MSVIVLKSALKDIAKLDNKMRDRIFNAIKRLARGEIKPNKLKGDDKGYKIPVGKYRILWKYKKEDITISRVKLRKEVYRNL